MLLRTMLLLGTAATLTAGLGAVGRRAQADPLRVGSPNVANIEPGVPHPDVTPCAVPLITAAQFANFNPVNYTYTPPAACPPPWSRVVLSMQLSVSAGVQYDRSGLLFMNGVPLWFGTTAEPRTYLSPRWSFQKDVTDYTALFEAGQTGQVDIGNEVNSQYTGVITASATLLFYPVAAGWPAPVTADVVLPLPSGGGAGSLGGPTDTISTSMVFPTNVLQAKLDLYLQGQGGDEFWYTCVPNAYTGPLESCGGGAVREGEVTVDSTPAGVSPVYPWIFTGGIDPLLWTPIPGVQTLDFKPYTVDLSPFAGVLDDGNTHTIAASVYGDNNYFQATGALRLFLDHGASVVTGGITGNTLAASPTVNTYPHITTNPQGVTSGTLNTDATHNFTISGTTTGSAGTTLYTVRQATSFTNDQKFEVNNVAEIQDIAQQTTVKEESSSVINGVNTATREQYSWPLTVDIEYGVGAAGGARETTSIEQEYLSTQTDLLNGTANSVVTLDDGINTHDVLRISNQGYIAGNSDQSETAKYLYRSPTICFGRSLAAAGNVLTKVATGCPK